MLGVEMAQHLHDIRRNMNAGAYPLEGPSLLVKPNPEAPALQQGGCRSPSKAGPDDGNSGRALPPARGIDARSIVAHPQTSRAVSTTSLSLPI
jgi:hypothetical protein